MKSVLGRQASINESDRLDQPGVEFLSERVDRLWQQNAVDVIGRIGVLAADVELAKRIPDHARAAQDHLLKCRVLPPGNVVDLVGADGVLRSAQARHDPVAEQIQVAGNNNLPEPRRHAGGRYTRAGLTRLARRLGCRGRRDRHHGRRRGNPNRRRFLRARGCRGKRLTGLRCILALADRRADHQRRGRPNE